MRLLFILVLSSFLISPLLSARSKIGGGDDDDFSEFDDDFDEEPSFPNSKRVDKKEESFKKESVEEVDDEQSANEESIDEKIGKRETKMTLDEDDESLVEDDDFEGGDDDDEMFEGGGRGREIPKLTITSVPMPLRGWQGYWAELLMLSGIGVYLLNYVLGRYKNQRIAQMFFDSHWSLLEENFYFLGDNSSKVDDELGTRSYSRMSDSVFQMWCSGRVCCEGMLLELKLLKRQDLVSLISNVFRPMRDTFRLTVELSPGDMDSLILAIVSKKKFSKFSKEYNDLVAYCPEKRNGDKYGLSTHYTPLAELGESLALFLDGRTVGVLNKGVNLVESIHVSDQFTGTKATEPEMSKEGVMKAPEARRLLIFTFYLPLSLTGNNVEEALEQTGPFIPLVFHTIDRIKKLKLSREGKAKADKNRSKVEEAFMKQTHAARAEALAARKEEQRRLEKERILQEDDPEKQRRWEEKEQKREKKRKAPKLKQLKVKAM